MRLGSGQYSCPALLDYVPLTAVLPKNLQQRFLASVWHGTDDALAHAREPQISPKCLSGPEEG
jgi:hypothetical protein